MEEGILDVELVYWPIAGDGKTEDGMDCGGLDDRTKGLVEVDAGTLGKATKNPASLVPIEGAVSMELVLEDLLAGDDVHAGGARNEIPGVVGEKSVVLHFHGGTLVRIRKGRPVSLGHRRQCGGMEIEPVNGLADAGLGACCHDVVINN